MKQKDVTQSNAEQECTIGVAITGGGNFPAAKTREDIDNTCFHELCKLLSLKGSGYDLPINLTKKFHEIFHKCLV